MNKEILTNERLGEQYIRVVHPSGLTILLCPMPDFATTYALFGTNYGSVDNCFKTDPEAEFTKLPDGIAHFLEHKLFESEDGDAFSLFAETGASANAYTSFDKTCYLFSCTDAFIPSLKALLTFVQAPYFTQQTVEKEQGIIGQEIRMYEDSPGWQVTFQLLEALYHDNPVKVDIAGTVESIAQIDADLLYRCYHTFYNLSNMVLSIAGKFDPDEALAVIEENLKPAEPKPIFFPPYTEPAEPVTSFAQREMDVSMPLFQLGFKIPPEEEPAAFLRQQYELELFHELLAGTTSSFYEEMLRRGIINVNFCSEVFAGRGFLTSMFGGESEDPAALQQALLARIQEVRERGLDPADFQCAKNAMYGRMVRGLNDVENVATAMLNARMSGVELFDTVEIAASVTLEDVERRLCQLTPDVMALSVIRPRSRS